MFDMTLQDSFFDDMFFRPALSMNKTFKELDKILDKGFPSLNRPHNLYTYKDESGNIIGNKLQVVTTPFKKEDVSVEISRDTLTIKCGSENKKDEDISSCVYHGISSQMYQFSLRLNEKVDKDHIEAKNEDGILTIKMPYKKLELEEAPVKITIL